MWRSLWCFLSSCSSCRRTSTLVVPSQPLVVPVGSEVTLPCELESVKNIKDLVVEWARHDLKPRYVHIRRDGLDLLIDQNSLYLGRTPTLFTDELKHGNISLKLTSVGVSDDGTYRCFVPELGIDSTVRLHVGKFTTPLGLVPGASLSQQQTDCEAQRLLHLQSDPELHQHLHSGHCEADR
uniref:Ig-like domain-containing protein n=1 Tax=Neogobius melanostomus TaxID=47308 RepID=A0A8C6WIN6_9GOBI